MLKALAILLLLPIDVVKVEPEWITVTTITLFVGQKAEPIVMIEGFGSGPIKMPKRLSNWTCRRGVNDRAEEVMNFVECRSGSATIMIDVSCRRSEPDADMGQVLLLNRQRDYAGRFMVTCMTSAEIDDHAEPETGLL